VARSSYDNKTMMGLYRRSKTDFINTQGTFATVFNLMRMWYLNLLAKAKIYKPKIEQIEQDRETIFKAIRIIRDKLSKPDVKAKLPPKQAPSPGPEVGEAAKKLGSNSKGGIPSTTLSLDVSEAANGEDDADGPEPTQLATDATTDQETEDSGNADNQTPASPSRSPKSTTTTSESSPEDNGGGSE